MAKNLLKTIVLSTALLVSGSSLPQADPQAKREPITFSDTGIEVKVGDFNNDGKTDFFVEWRAGGKSKITIMYLESNKEGKYTNYVFDSSIAGQVRIEEIAAGLPKELRDYLNSEK